MGIKVSKFGGSSVADAVQIKKMATIVTTDPDRRFLICSAPGKRTSADTKVTDLLYRLHELRYDDYTDTMNAIKLRYTEIAADLGVTKETLDFDAEFTVIEEQLVSGAGRDYLASRGEYLHCKLIAAHLGWPFVDAAEMICFSKSGELMAAQTDEQVTKHLAGLEKAVIPGFYGATVDGDVRTFSRGGSDVTGALIARVVRAEVYENWTDVSGILMADPRIVENPRTIDRLSYTALRELTYLGASVLHEDAVNPVRERGIPINIRNTNRPDDPGTWVQADAPTANPGDVAIIGLAGKQGYTAITLRKPQWSGFAGVSGPLFSIFGDAGLVLDLALTSIDGWTVAVSTDDLAPVRQQVLAQIDSIMEPATIEIENGLSLLGVISSGALPNTILTGRVTTALCDSLMIFIRGGHYAVTETDDDCPHNCSTCTLSPKAED